jgi:hypothetical protein
MLLTTIGASLSGDNGAIVNMMIDAHVPASPTIEQANKAEANLLAMFDEIDERKLSASVFPTNDLVSSYARLRLTAIGSNPNFELAMSGNNSNEKLSSQSYEEQKSILTKSKSSVETCRICGKNEVNVMGFMPQSFDQNQYTYKVLDDLGVQYDTGFQAGLMYAPGHKDDVWPYLLEGHKFYAVPVSTYSLSGDKVVLQDSYFKDKGFSATQWYNSLVAKFDEIQDRDEPLVISLNTSVSSSGDYLDVLNRFMDYAISKKAEFVTTSQLVEMARTDIRDAASLPTIVSGECLTCGQSEQNGISITASSNATNPNAGNSTQNSTPEAVAALK